MNLGAGHHCLPVIGLLKTVADMHDPAIRVGQIDLAVPRPPLRRLRPRRPALTSGRQLSSGAALTLNPLRLRSLLVKSLIRVGAGSRYRHPGAHLAVDLPTLRDLGCRRVRLVEVIGACNT
jgi:hypothetical protein